jgi:hypothetical protein
MFVLVIVAEGSGGGYGGRDRGRCAGGNSSSSSKVVAVVVPVLVVVEAMATLLTTKLIGTNYMERIHPLEANIRSSCQTIPCLLRLIFLFTEARDIFYLKER